MKQITTILLLFLALACAGQEQTIEVLNIFSRPDMVICSGDTISPIYFRVERTTTENLTNYPNVSIDTILYQWGNCPADSLQVLFQIRRDAEELQNRASGTMSNAFDRARRGHATFLQVRTTHNNFTGEDLYLYLEEEYWPQFQGTYRIVDVQAGTSVLADMIRIGADERYRLEVQDGEPGAGTRYTVIPLSRTSFRINAWTPAGGSAANFKLYQDRGVDNTRPVFRENGYIEGGADDILRIIKVN